MMETMNMNISSLGRSAFKPSPSKRGQGCRKRVKGFKAGVLLLASGLFLTSLNASPSYAYNLRAPFDMSATDVVTVRLHTPSLRALIDEQMGPGAVETELGILRNDVEAVIAEINSVHNSALALEIGADIEVFYDAEVVTKLMQRIPKVQRIDIPHAGHMLPLEVPLELTRGLKQFAANL